MSIEVSFLSSLRDMQENDQFGVILPSGTTKFRFARGCEALSKKTIGEAQKAIDQMETALSKPTRADLLTGCETILCGNQKVQELLTPALKRFLRRGLKPGVIPSRFTQAIMTIRKEYLQTLRQSVQMARSNLSVAADYGRRIGGRKGAEELLRQMIAYNPGHLLITCEDHELITAVNQKVVAQYLQEAGKDKKALTLTDAREINRRIQGVLGNKQFGMPYDKELENSMVAAAHKTGSLDGLTLYRAKMAARLYPTLDALVAQGKIQNGKPLLLVEAGNNDIRNNMQTDLVRVLVKEYLADKGLTVPVQVHLLSFGGHPTTGTFVAHVEVMTAQERCKLLKKLAQDPEKKALISQALLESAFKLPTPEGREAALKILKSEMNEALQALLQNDQTREIFRIVGGRNHTIHHPEFQPKHRAGLEKSIYMFNGVGESTTHAGLSIKAGHQDPAELRLDELSRDTGENIEFLSEQMPENEKPVILFFDAYRTGRQVVSLSKQLTAPWSTIVSPLIDIPLEHYADGLVEEQLYADTASLFAELGRNIAYRTTDQFVDAFPIDDRNYGLLTRYYAAIAGVSADQAAQTPITQLFPAVRKEFERFELTFKPGHDQKEHQAQLADFYDRQRARKLLVGLADDHFDSKKSSLARVRIPLRVVPKRFFKTPS